MSESRAFTKTEVRKQFLDYIRKDIEYWAREPGLTDKARCESVAFSILVILDGEHGTLPAFDLVLAPNPTEKAWAKKNKAKWYEPKMVINDDSLLHNELFQTYRTPPKTKAIVKPVKKPKKRETNDLETLDKLTRF